MVCFYNGFTQRFAQKQGELSPYFSPNLIGFSNQHCGNTQVIPSKLNENELIYSLLLDQPGKNKEVSTTLTKLYFDSRVIINEIASLKDKACLVNYKLFNGFKSKWDEEITLSISGNSCHVKRHQVNKDGTTTGLTIWSIFSDEKLSIKQLECYGDKTYPKYTGSVTFKDEQILFAEDTLKGRCERGSNFIMIRDKKDRPLKTWYLDSEKRLVKFQTVVYSDLGVLRIDSTTIRWENDHVQRISFLDQTSVCTYDSLGNIAEVKNFRKGTLINTFEYRYEYDQKGNWNVFEVNEIQPGSSKRLVKYYIRRKITYKDIRSTF